ncbi:MAG TPA: GSU2403 family nucleotidyltransferase fold protein [Longimicrobium sp.]|jgi:hypothetical protein
MSELARLERGLRAVLWELRDYLPDLVLIGGWAPHLHRRYGPFADWRGDLSLTSELDLLVNRHLARAGRPSLPDILTAADFDQAPGSSVNAVWARRADAGELIEFLVPFAGRPRRGQVTVPVQEQPGLTAIPLHHVDMLARHTTVLRIPILTHHAEVTLEVHVPTLGAYAVNKAYTFSRRGTPNDPGEAPKSAKDLLYLHDLMAAGAAVADQIERDVAAVAGGSPADADQVRGAASHLGLALKGGELGRHLDVTVSMLMERTGSPDRSRARATLLGHLTDLHDILTSIIGGGPRGSVPIRERVGRR